MQVIRLVDEILNLTLIEAADLCDLCQEKLAERSGRCLILYRQRGNWIGAG